MRFINRKINKINVSFLFIFSVSLLIGGTNTYYLDDEIYTDKLIVDTDSYLGDRGMMTLRSLTTEPLGRINWSFSTNNDVDIYLFITDRATKEAIWDSWFELAFEEHVIDEFSRYIVSSGKTNDSGIYREPLFPVMGMRIVYITLINLNYEDTHVSYYFEVLPANPMEIILPIITSVIIAVSIVIGVIIIIVSRKIIIKKKRNKQQLNP
ncbi:MAG: hypothetical protein ACFFBP_19430 [Promethearchaeota archaeon]